MKPNIRLLNIPQSLSARFLDSNPQLFRELRGKLKTRNIVIAAAIAVMTQFMAVILLLGKLPAFNIIGNQCGRYGMALVYQEYSHQVCYAQNAAQRFGVHAARGAPLPTAIISSQIPIK